MAAVQAEIARELSSPVGAHGGPQCGPVMGPQGVDPARAISEVGRSVARPAATVGAGASSAAAAASSDPPQM